jgi:ubiquitin carboxyl-terminal hydrolase 1
LRISDDNVKEVGIDTVLGERTGSFMLYYERVLPFQSDSLRTSPRSSQETVMPHQEEKKVKLEGLMDGESVGSFNARIIRSVSVSNRSREGSIKPSGETEAIMLNGGPVVEESISTNGHADPDAPLSTLAKEKDHKEMNGIENGKFLNGLSNIQSPLPTILPPDSPPLQATHHTPRNPSPVRTVNLMA